MSILNLSNEVKTLLEKGDAAGAFWVVRELSREKEDLIAKVHIFDMLHIGQMVQDEISKSGIKTEQLFSIRFIEHSPHDKFQYKFLIEIIVSDYVDDKIVKSICNKITPLLAPLEKTFGLVPQETENNIWENGYFEIDCVVNKIKENFMKTTIREDLLKSLEMEILNQKLSNKNLGKSIQKV